MLQSTKALRIPAFRCVSRGPAVSSVRWWLSGDFCVYVRVLAGRRKSNWDEGWWTCSLCSPRNTIWSCSGSRWQSLLASHQGLLILLHLEYSRLSPLLLTLFLFSHGSVICLSNCLSHWPGVMELSPKSNWGLFYYPLVWHIQNSTVWNSKMSKSKSLQKGFLKGAARGYVSAYYPHKSL